MTRPAHPATDAGTDVPADVEALAKAVAFDCASLIAWRQFDDVAARIVDAIMADREARSADQSKAVEERNTPQQKAFWDWLPKAYRDGDVGHESKFTKYNMEVAHLAGWQAALSTRPDAPGKEPGHG